MTSTVKLQNTNKHYQREIHSADGDSVNIMPDSVQEVDSKFNWRLPPDVCVFRPKHTVFGKKGPKEVSSEEIVKEQAVDVKEARVVLSSGNTPAPPVVSKKKD